MKPPSISMFEFADAVKSLGIVGISEIAYVSPDDPAPAEEDRLLEIAFGGGERVLLTSAGDGERLCIRQGAWDDPFAGPLDEVNLRYIERSGVWRRLPVEETSAKYEWLFRVRPLMVSQVLSMDKVVVGVLLTWDGRSLCYRIAFDEGVIRVDSTVSIKSELHSLLAEAVEI